MFLRVTTIWLVIASLLLDRSSTYELWTSQFRGLSYLLFGIIKAKGCFVKKVLFFDSMLTPKLITIIYWIMLVLVIVGGVTGMFAGYEGLTLGSFLKGIVILAGGAILSRVWCELLIVLFKIHENLQKIADKSE